MSVAQKRTLAFPESESDRRLWEPGLSVLEPGPAPIAVRPQEQPASDNPPTVLRVFGGRERPQDLLDRIVLDLQVRLDLLGLLQHGRRVVIGRQRTRVSRGGLHVLPDDDDRQQDQLQERLGDPPDDDERLTGLEGGRCAHQGTMWTAYLFTLIALTSASPVLQAAGALTGAISVKRYAVHIVPTSRVIFSPNLALNRPIGPGPCIALTASATLGGPLAFRWSTCGCLT